ncbi:MAG: hypothetical protein HETSPECPRED_001544 [Heterodermia speciosa]|uniref:Uncharacterized protein n=1 Tax=Heterodermia speciosa TaxID=116794 RepID=A0A8H3PF66_9LECA|nr:MAG: hypothetical protein HETSPECPRED_001544 [Heterodermia speciosa]
MGLTEGLANAGVVAASVATQEAMTAANPAGALAGAAGKFGQSQPTVVVVGNQQGQTNASAAQSSTSAAPIPVPAVPATNTPGVVDEAAAQSAQSKKESALNKLRVAFSKSKAFKTAGANVKAKKEAASIGKAPVNGDVNVDASFPAAMPDTTVPDGDGKADHFSTTNTRISARAVDWESILPPGTKDEKGRDKSSKAQTIYFNLERKNKEFKPDAKGLASQLTSRIIAEAFEVVTEMLEEAKKAKGIAEWQKPAVDSEQIKSWDERIAVCADVSSTVKQSAVSQPGMASGIVASLFPKKTEAETVTSSNFKANVAEQTVKAATTKLTSAQEVYKSTMATYQAMNEQKDKMAAELTKARAEVAELQMQSVTADNLRKVLVQCIGFLSQLKFKISKLVEFFSSVSIYVDGIVDSQVKTFGDTVQNMIAEHPDDALMHFNGAEIAANSAKEEALSQPSTIGMATGAEEPEVDYSGM